MNNLVASEPSYHNGIVPASGEVPESTRLISPTAIVSSAVLNLVSSILKPNGISKVISVAATVPDLKEPITSMESPTLLQKPSS